MTWIVGVDVGGTFTDFCALNEDTAESLNFKTPSTPEHPAQAIVAGLKTLCRELGIEPGKVARLDHGTTVATNALIQRHGARVALITTKGFRDLLEIGRQIRPHMYDLNKDAPAPLVPRELRFEVSERVLADGRVRKKLDDAELTSVVDAIAQSGVEGCAVCLLFSFLNPDHERRIAAYLRRALPNLHVSVSSEVQPEFREYERLSTTTLNAYLQPLMSRYLSELSDSVSRLASGIAIGVSQSAGGLMSIERARDMPVRTALSGPAAGVTGAIAVARRANRPNLITFDMGGTSTDVCLIRNFAFETAFQRSVADFPIRLPMVDIETIGAGGGSIAWFDRDGLLKVGPVSAGADPGPASYGKGGTQPTVTDANLLLGRLSDSGLIGGRMPLSAGAARRAFEPVAARLGFSPERTAHGVLSIAVSNMVRALRSVSVEKGHDPRNFVLVAFGGAGPLHASDVARSLGIRELLIPPAPGILCAQGLVVSELREEFVSTLVTPLDGSSRRAIDKQLGSLLAQTRTWFDREGAPLKNRHLSVQLEMRFKGQNFELPVKLDVREDFVPEIPEDGPLKQRFLERHQKTYGYADETGQVEIVNYRVSAFARFKRLASLPEGGRRSSAPRAVPERLVYFDFQSPLMTPVYWRPDIAYGREIVGPAIVEQLDSTTLIFPGDCAKVDDAGNIMIEIRK